MSRFVTRFGCIAAALTFVCAVAPAASATPGQLDPAFGPLGNGTVLADHGHLDGVVKVLRQADGKIVAVANGQTPNLDPTLVVLRYLTNGALDPSFGTAGVFTANLPSSASLISDGALQADGKIAVTGSAGKVAARGFWLTRLLGNGTPDASFKPPQPFTSFGANVDAQANALALGPGGTIVVAGRAGTDTAIARYTSSGALDTTFSGDGLVTQSFGGQSEGIDVVVQPDGRIVVGGSVGIETQHPSIVVARFDTNGNLDATFGSGGRVDAHSTPIRAGQALLLQGTKIVVAGAVDIPSDGISRYAANGAIDPGFGTNGTVRVRIGQFAHVSELVTDAAGRIVAAGSAAFSQEFPDLPSFVAVWRFSANGAPDATFGCGGSALTEVLGNGAGTTYNAAGAASAVTAGNDIVVGGSATHFNGTDFPPTDDLLARYRGTDPPPPAGYALVRGDGGTTAFGAAPACGSVDGLGLNAPVVGAAFDPAAPGNWTVASDGGVFTFGASHFFGSMGGLHLAAPIVGMAAAPDGKGYWLVASDGGVFAFGSAHFFGSMGGLHLVAPVVGMAATRDGKGYWLVASDGGVFAFGSAHFSGSMGGVRLAAPVVGMAADPDGRGYWLVASDGGVFAFEARFSGSTGGLHLAAPVVGMAADADGTGYWLGARDGGVFAFSAPFAGSTAMTPFPPGSPRVTVGIVAAP